MAALPDQCVITLPPVSRKSKGLDLPDEIDLEREDKPPRRLRLWRPPLPGIAPGVAIPVTAQWKAVPTCAPKSAFLAFHVVPQPFSKLPKSGKSWKFPDEAWVTGASHCSAD